MKSTNYEPHVEAHNERDHATWSLLMVGYAERMRLHGCAQFIDGFYRLGFGHSIEPFAKLNRRVHAACGWNLIRVDGLLPDVEFFSLLSEKVFPIAAQMRGPDEIEFAELPDLFHDALGHLPLLLQPIYSDFLQRYAETALRHIASPSSLEKLQRFYWYTAETGLVLEHGRTKYVGAAISTSKFECENSMSVDASCQPFSFEAVFKACYNSFQVQRQYFVLDSFTGIGEQVRRLEGALHRYEDDTKLELELES